MYPQHPDDEEFYSGTWADQFATYEDACAYYGADSPASLAAEAEWEDKQDRLWQKDMEAAFGPYVPVKAFPACNNKLIWDSGDLDDEIPF